MIKRQGELARFRDLQGMQQESTNLSSRREFDAKARPPKIRQCAAALLALGLALIGVPHLRAATRTAARARHHSTHPVSRVKATAPRKKVAHASSHAKSPRRHVRRTATAKRRTRKTRKTASRRRPNTYTRLAHMQMDPSRVEHIQQALIGAGALQGAPTGHWDSETRDAMARYQSENGFGVTGLPDAKSLMKLGLGPHPLPPQLDKTATAPGADVQRPLQPSGAAAPSAPLGGGESATPAGGVPAPAGAAVPPAAAPEAAPSTQAPPTPKQNR